MSPGIKYMGSRKKTLCAIYMKVLKMAAQLTQMNLELHVNYKKIGM